MTIDDYPITHYHDRRCPPFLSISRLPEAEAFALAGRLAAHREDSFTSMSRFGRDDFAGYYALRLRAEAWLHERFLAHGGRPETRHPLYFVLGGSDYLRRWYQDGAVTRIPLSRIDAAHISFTMGDSMSRLDAPDRMDVFTKPSLQAHLAATDEGLPAFLENLNAQNRYVEVQLWSDRYVSAPPGL